EHPPAEVAEQRAVERPAERGERGEAEEARPLEVREAARERGRGSTAGHEARDDDQHPTALVQVPARPVERALAARAGEEAALHRLAREPPERVRGVVAD